MKINLENKKFLLRNIEVMKKDLDLCRSYYSKESILNGIEIFEKELSRYKKPIYIEPTYEEAGIIYKIEYGEYTDEELSTENFAENYRKNFEDKMNCIIGYNRFYI